MTSQDLQDAINDELIEKVAKQAYTNSLDLATKGQGAWEEIPDYGRDRTRQMVSDVLAALVSALREGESADVEQ